MAPNEIRQLSFRPIPPPLTELEITYPDGIYLGEPVPHDERNGDPKNRIHTDAIITILPQHLANIVSSTKRIMNIANTEFLMEYNDYGLRNNRTNKDKANQQSHNIALIPLNIHLEPDKFQKQNLWHW